MSPCRLLLALLGAALLLAPAGSGQAGPSAGLPSPDEVTELLERNPPAYRNPAILRASVLPGAAAAVPPPTGGPGFWIQDQVRGTIRWAPVALAYTSPRADWFVEAGKDVSRQALDNAARRFEEQLFPRIAELTGTTYRPGEDGTPRLAVFNGVTPGVGGYMTSHDGYPRSVFPYSNERLTIYLNVDNVRPGTDGYARVLAHELEHLLHWTVNPGQEGWLDEGLAEVASALATGAPASGGGSFRGQPDTQLTAWSEKPWEAGIHYQASHLWARYLLHRGGGPAAMADLVGAGGRGLQTVEQYGRRRIVGSDARDLFRDWLVANLVDDASLEDGRYGYPDLSVQLAAAQQLAPDGPAIQATVSQFGADYYDLRDARGGLLRVEVEPTVRLVPTDGARGGVFWGQRGDNSATSMSRWLDLRGVPRATLQFRAWYDLEPSYDFCYLLASHDGQLWTALETTRTTTANPFGAALGPGLSGRSSDWVDDAADLTPFAGAWTAVRFECVCDQGYSSHGLALDELAVPEIGFRDDGDQDQGWELSGFVRAPNGMRQPFLVAVVELVGRTLSIRHVPVDAQGRAEVRLADAPDVRWSAAIVSGLAPVTLVPASYSIELTR